MKLNREDLQLGRVKMEAIIIVGKNESSTIQELHKKFSKVISLSSLFKYFVSLKEQGIVIGERPIIKAEYEGKIWNMKSKEKRWKLTEKGLFMLSLLSDSVDGEKI